MTLAFHPSPAHISPALVTSPLWACAQSLADLPGNHDLLLPIIPEPCHGRRRASGPLVIWLCKSVLDVPTGCFVLLLPWNGSQETGRQRLMFCIIHQSPWILHLLHSLLCRSLQWPMNFPCADRWASVPGIFSLVFYSEPTSSSFCQLWRQF